MSFKQFFKVAANPGQDIQKWLADMDSKMPQIAEMLLQYLEEKVVTQLKTDLGKHFKYVQFLFQVYNSKVDPTKLVEIFQKCMQAVDKATELGAKT
jgi:hypothetical protein